MGTKCQDTIHYVSLSLFLHLSLFSLFLSLSLSLSLTLSLSFIFLCLSLSQSLSLSLSLSLSHQQRLIMNTGYFLSLVSSRSCCTVLVEHQIVPQCPVPKIVVRHAVANSGADADINIYYSGLTELLPFPYTYSFTRFE
jgi:hypothetical protein